jgi:hypothetical protein
VLDQRCNTYDGADLSASPVTGAQYFFSTRSFNDAQKEWALAASRQVDTFELCMCVPVYGVRVIRHFNPACLALPSSLSSGRVTSNDYRGAKTEQRSNGTAPGILAKV